MKKNWLWANIALVCLCPVAWAEELSLRPQDSGVYIGVQPVVSFVSLPETKTIGVLYNGSPVLSPADSKNYRADNTLKGYGIEWFAGLPMAHGVFGGDGRIELRITSSEVDHENTDRIAPSAGNAIGVAMWVPDAGYGIIVANNEGVYLYEERTALQRNAEFRWYSDLALGDKRRLSPYIGITHGDLDQDIDGRYGRITAGVPSPDFVVDVDIDQDFSGLEAGADFSLPLAGRWGLAFSGSAAWLRSTIDLKSYRAENLFGGSSVEQEKDTVDAYQLGVGAAVNYGFIHGGTLDMGIHYEYHSDIATLAYPDVSVPGGLTGSVLDSGHGEAWQLEMAYRLPF